MDDSVVEISNLKGKRVDPHLRIYQVDKLLMQSDNLTQVQRRSLVSRRNTAKLRLRQRKEREYSMLVRVHFDAVVNLVSPMSSCHLKISIQAISATALISKPTHLLLR